MAAVAATRSGAGRVAGFGEHDAELGGAAQRESNVCEGDGAEFVWRGRCRVGGGQIGGEVAVSDGGGQDRFAVGAVAVGRGG
jgi:hypothetical protein